MHIFTLFLGSLIELSRDITEISPLWELLPFNLSWSPIGSRQSNDWPIVAKHANTASSRQYKCDARDNYIRIFYFTLNSWWLQCVRSARDPSNRWISISIASPAWAWLTPRRRWTSPTVDFARTSRSACSGPAAMWFAAWFGSGSLPPACRWWAPPLRAAGAPSCRAVEPNWSPHSPISFPEDCFRPPSNIEGFVAFGHEEGDEAMVHLGPRRRTVGLDRSPSS